MSGTITNLELENSWQPVSQSLDELRDESSAFVDCADSILQEVESIQHELIARAREVDQLAIQLAMREQQLAEQRSDFNALLGRFDQQSEQLTSALEEIRALRVELKERPTGQSSGAEPLSELWQQSQAEILERLTALSAAPSVAPASDEACDALRLELESEAARHQEEELRWREELQQLRGLIQQTVSIVKATEREEPAVAATGAQMAEKDAVAKSLMAQFAKLHKDSARRRNQDPNS